MTKDYIKLIIDSWAQNAQKIENIFYREFKAADKEDIPPDELFDYLIKAVDWLEQERQRPYHKRLERWNDILCAKAEKGIEYDMPIPEDTYTLPLAPLTDLKIHIQLSKGDLLYIKESIGNAHFKYKREQLKNSPNTIKDSYVEAFNNEVTPERIAELKEMLSKIEPYSKRIEFLEKEKIKYLQDISPETLFISGVTSTAMGTRGALFFDRFIELEIQNERLKSTIVTETETEQKTGDLKPVLNSEAVQIVFDILKGFFSPEHQTELKNVIETGSKASKKLLFKGNGNRLSDTFKKLIEHDFITGFQKQDLINWIISNFQFTHQNKEKPFVYDTVEKTISRNYYPCKSPLIEIKNGQIHKVEQPRKRKQSKY